MGYRWGSYDIGDIPRLRQNSHLQFSVFP